VADIRRKVTILGATGSIGISTLEVIRLNQSAFNVFALTANSNVEKMLEQCLATKPRFAVMRNDEAAAKLRELLKHNQSFGHRGAFW
jgi:1-deoxy-D-xylulose-5-phosphate reductoisomerase